MIRLPRIDLLYARGESENRRRAKYYKLTAAGRRWLGEEMQHWAQALVAITRILDVT